MLEIKKKQLEQQIFKPAGADMVGFVPIVLGPMILIINQQGIPKTLIENTGIVLIFCKSWFILFNKRHYSFKIKVSLFIIK